MHKSGYLYIITNPNIKGWVKVGITENLDKRLQQYQTADPFRGFEIVFSLYHPDYKLAEKKIKEAFKPFAKTIKNEWFEVDFLVAKVRLEESLEEFQQIS